MINGKINIKIIGIGGGGGNAVNHIAMSCGDKSDFVAVNTDIYALNEIDLPNKLQIGRELTRGFGSGAKPEKGCQAAEESYEGLSDDATANFVFSDAGCSVIIDIGAGASGITGGRGFIEIEYLPLE